MGAVAQAALPHGLQQGLLLQPLPPSGCSCGVLERVSVCAVVGWCSLQGAKRLLEKQRQGIPFNQSSGMWLTAGGIGLCCSSGWQGGAVWFLSGAHAVSGRCCCSWQVGAFTVCACVFCAWGQQNQSAVSADVLLQFLDCCACCCAGTGN